MGLDRLGRVRLLLLVVVLAGCDHQRHPDRLLNGERAATLAQVPGERRDVRRRA